MSELHATRLNPCAPQYKNFDVLYGLTAAHKKVLDGISHLRYGGNRYGTFPAISDACLARRFLPKLGLHSCGPFFLFNTLNELDTQGQFGAGLETRKIR
jgi:hypothetical protein